MTATLEDPTGVEAPETPAPSAPSAPPDPQPNIAHIPKEFLAERDGKTFVLYRGLLAMAHQQGLKSIVVELIQIPSADNGNVAISRATVITDKGTYVEIGDAGPGNVTRLIAPHAIRMSATRSKARALRDATNVGVAALEELGPDGNDSSDAYDAVGEPVRGRTQQQRPANAKTYGTPQRQTTAPARPAQTQRPGQAQTGGPPASPKQLETITRMSRAAGKNIDVDGLTRAQASEIIQGLIDEMGQARSNDGGQRTARPAPVPDDDVPLDEDDEPGRFLPDGAVNMNQAIQIGERTYTRAKILAGIRSARASLQEANVDPGPTVRNDLPIKALSDEWGRLVQLVRR